MGRKDPSAEALIRRGLEHHRAGRLQESKSLYEQALTIQPRHPDALHLAGVVALQGGDAERAVQLIRQAVEIQPENPGFHANLGQGLLALRRVADAQAAFRRAAALDPRAPQFAVAAASCLAIQGSLAQAEHELRAVAQRHPDYALAWYNLGNAIQEQGRRQEAIELYHRAIELDPGHVDAHNNLGRALHGLERLEEAEAAYRRSIALKPDYVTAHCNLASVLKDQGRFAESATVCVHALQRAPGSPELNLLLGSAQLHQGRLSQALEAYRAAANAAPANPRALWAVGYTLIMVGRESEGLEWLERARDAQPDAAELRSAASSIDLALGELEAGWKGYEWRPARRSFLTAHPGLRLTLELPEELSGVKICLIREQGLGDELFFLRFAAAVKARGAKIIYRANPRIASMLERAPLLDEILPADLPLPIADCYLLVGDLPRALGALDFPPPLALAPLPQRLEAMKTSLGALGPPPYIGLTWRAGIAPEQQRGTDWVHHKAVPLEALGGALREVAGTLIALQRNPERIEIERLASIAGRPVHDLSRLNEDLEGMLALLALADDYIGVSNTNMHLRAGAGRSARVLVPGPAEWRWMVRGEESPWFPGFRIYRQAPDGDWSDALARVAADLRMQQSVT
jgi:tetratricopeptide (TPR) repeat protein